MRVYPGAAEQFVEEVCAVQVIVVAQNAQQKALAEAAWAQEHLVRQRLQKRNAPGVVHLVAVELPHVAEVAYSVWYGLDIVAHDFSSRMQLPVLRLA